jgi:chromosome segregation ATPase
MPDRKDTDRFDGQRKALSSLLARFTADRDSLITSIQECQQQLATIASHVDGGNSGGAEGLAEVKRLIEQMRQGQERAEATRERFDDMASLLVRLQDDRDAQALAMERYEAQLVALLERVEALQLGAAPLADLNRAIEDLRSEQSRLGASLQSAIPVNDNGESAELLERLSREQQLMSSALGEARQQLADLVARVKAAPAADHTPADLVHKLEEVESEQQRTESELRTAVAQALAGAGDTLSRLEDLEAAQAMRAQAGAAAGEQLAALQSSFTAAVAGCQTQIADLGTRLDAALAGDGGPLAELRAQLEANGGAQARTVADEMRSWATAALGRAEEQAVARLGRLAHVEDTTARLLAQQDDLRKQLEQTRQRLDKVAARARTTPGPDSKEIESLRQQVATLHSEQQQLAGDLRGALAAAVDRAAETARLLQTSTGQLEQRLDGTGAETQRLAAEQGTLAIAVGACREQLTDLRTQVDVVRGDTQPQLSELGGRIDELEAMQRELRTQAQEAVDSALLQANAALNELRDLVAQQGQRVAEADGQRSDLAAQQRQLDEALVAARAQIADLARLLEATQAAGTPQLETLRQRIDALQMEQQAVERRTEAAIDGAIGLANDAVARLETLAVARDDQHTDLRALLTESAADRQQLHAAVDEVRAQLLEAAARSEAVTATSSAVEAVQQSIESVRAQQQESESRVYGAIERATEQATVALRQAETVATAQRQGEADADALAALLAEHSTALQAALRQCQQQIAGLSAAVEATGTSAPRIDALAVELEQLRTQIGEQRDVAHAALAQVAEQASDTVRRLTTLEEGLVAQQAAAQARRGSDGEIARSLHEHRQQLVTLAEQLQRSETDLRGAVSQALERAGETLTRLAELETAQAARAQDGEAATVQLAAVQDSFAAALAGCREQIATLAATADAAGVATPRVDALAGEVQQLRTELDEQRSGSGSALAYVAEQAAEALRGLVTFQEVLVGQQSDVDARRRFEGEIGQSLQESRQQLTVLAEQMHAQLDSGGRFMHDLQQLVEEDRQGTRDALEGVCTTATTALERAASLHDELATVRQQVEVTCQRSDDLALAVEQQRAALPAVAQRLDEHVAEVASRLSAQESTARQVSERLSQQQADAHRQAEELAGLGVLAAQVAAALERIDALTANHGVVEQTAEALSRRIAVEEETRATVVRACEQELADLAARLDVSDTREQPRWVELCALVEHLQQQLAETQRRTGSVLAEAQARLVELAKGVYDATTAQAETLATLHEQVDAVRGEQATLRLSVADADERLQVVAAQRLQPPQSDAAVDELRRALEQMQLDQRLNATQLGSTLEQVRTRSDEAVSCVADLAAAHRHRDEHTSEALGRLGAEREALLTTLGEHESRIGEVGARLAEVERRDIVDAQARATAGQAAARADAVLRCVDDLVSVQNNREAQTVEALRCVSTECETLRETLDEQTRRVDSVGAQLEEVERRDPADALARAAAQQAGAHAEAALRRVDALAAAQRSSDEQTSQRDSRLDAERAALRANLDELREQFADTATRLDAAGEAARRDLDDLRQHTEQVRLERQQAEQEVRVSVQTAQARADAALHAVDDLRSTTASLQQQAEEVGLLQTQTDHLAAALSRLEARVLSPTGGPPRRSEPVVNVPGSHAHRQRKAAHSRWPALAASMLILATLGTALFVLPGAHDLGSWFSRQPPRPASVAGLDDPQAITVFTTAIEALRRGDFDVAEAGLREVLRIDPRCVEARNNLAAVLVEQHHLEAAAEQLREALAMRPDYTRARANLEHVEALLSNAHPAPGAATDGAAAANPASPPVPIGAAHESASEALPEVALQPSIAPEAPREAAGNTEQIHQAAPAAPARPRPERSAKRMPDWDDDEDPDFAFDLP